MSIGAAAWLVGSAAGTDQPFWLMSIVVVSVSLFSGITPAPPGFLGVYEFAAVSTLGLFEVDPSAALTFALAIHRLLFLPPCTLLVDLSFAYGITTWSFVVGATQPPTWSTSVILLGNDIPLWSIDLPPIPPITISFSFPIPPIGVIEVQSTLEVEGTLCAASDAVDTGP